MYPILKSLLLLCVAVAMFSLIPVYHAYAADLDGSTPVLCGITSAAGCDSIDGCEAATADDLGLPQFFRIDFKAKKITALGVLEEGMRKETEIRSFERRDGMLILQGVDLRGWSMVITEKIGKMTLTASGVEEAFVFFGACIIPQ
jgi:hypothetical protein